MLYRFAKPNSHAFSATDITLRGLKTGIEVWYPRQSVTYKLDEYSEGWAYLDGKPLGYIDTGHYEK